MANRALQIAEPGSGFSASRGAFLRQTLAASSPFAEDRSTFWQKDLGMEEGSLPESSGLGNGHVGHRLPQERSVEKGNDVLLSDPKRVTVFPRRKVSAVRTFPPGCGRFAPKINQEKPIENALEEPRAAAQRSLQEGPEPSKSSKDSELVKSSKELNSGSDVDMSNKVSKAGSEMVDLVKGLDRTHRFVPSDKSNSNMMEVLQEPTQSEEHQEPQSLQLSENLNHVEMTPMPIGVDETEPMPPFNDSVLPQMRAPVGETQKEDVSRKYPHKRRVSATRDFPPFCGRNARVLTEEERLEILGDTNPIFVQPISECKPSRDMLGKEDGGGNPPGNGSGQMPTIVQAEDASVVRMQRIDMTEIRVKDEAADDSDLYFSRNVDRAVKNPMVTVSRKENIARGLKSDRPIIYSQRGGFAAAESSTPKVVVQALMAAPNCPWRREKRLYTPKKLETGFVSNRKKTKLEKQKAQHDEVDKKDKQKVKQNQVDDEDIWSQQAEEDEVDEEDFDLNSLPEFTPLPTVPTVDLKLNASAVDLKQNVSAESITRKRVRETLRLFQACCRKLLQEEESKSKDQGQVLKRVDLRASKLLREKNKWVNTGKQILGNVPGVEVGDEFHFRAELCAIGLHRQYMAGIDYLKERDRVLATSIVSSGGYNDEHDNVDVLIYSGHGGQPGSAEKQAKDQELIRGNLALKKSMEAQTPVRVIRGVKEKASDSHDSKLKMTYTYDGLYLVEKYWMEKENHGGSVFKFQLRRIPGQPELAVREMKKSKKLVREGLCVKDISEGKEKKPICAINTIDNEKPPPFKYTTKVIYPPQHDPTPPNGCDCIDGCSDSEKCFCAVRNGGEIPFNHDGAIVEAKILVYECGPFCKCPPSCHNRVSQHGIKFQLEIFKTESRGWGVRSLNSIPSGSFICEYTGELLHDTDAEKRDNDEYLFDIGQNYNDHALWEGLSSVIPDSQTNAICEVVETRGFTIDAAQYGNVGRFINHSCSPNLYAQNLLYDHDDKSLPHIMLFAAENIRPLQELTYHYNYTLDQVRDDSGNIKKKPCYCGSHECSGRLY